MTDGTAQNAPSSLEREKFRVLQRISRCIASHRNLSELIRDQAACFREALSFDFLAVVLHDAARTTMRVHVLGGSHPTALSTGTEVAVDGSPTGWVWQTQKPLIIPSVEQETRFPDLMTFARGHGVKSLCVLPLATAQRRVGVLGFGSFREDAYRDTDPEFLHELADAVALAFDNALNFEKVLSYQAQLARERDRLGLLLEVNNVLVSKRDTRDLLNAISVSLRRVMHHDYTALVLHDSESNELRVRVLDYPGGKGLIEEELALPVEGTPVGQAFTSRKPVLLSRTDLERFPPDIARRLAGEGVKSACSLPLFTPNRTLGTLNLASLRENAFSSADLELLGQVANQVAIAIENALAFQEIAELRDKLAQEKLYLEDEIRTEYNFSEIIGESEALKRVLRHVETVASTDSAVLIQGETGTGKELIARAIHNLSKRGDRTFVKINCAAIPTGLLESELFGHEKGAFTGAIAQKVGRFELANKGTLFLDEVGDIPLELQPKLLRVLQEQEFERLGGIRTLRVDVRIVAATNRDLAQMVSKGEFRSDLYYRLNVFPVLVPPLRERPEDIPLLVRYFVQKHARRMDKRIDTIPAETLSALTRYSWPGNVRELENFIERSVILSRGPILNVPLAELKQPSDAVVTAAKTLESAEREHILKVLRETDWIVGGPRGAAARLGIKRTTLYSRMKKLGISPSKS